MTEPTISGSVRGARPEDRQRAELRWQRLRRRSRAFMQYDDRVQDSRRRIAQGISAADLQELERIANAETARYRFPPELEAQFQNYARLSSRAARISVALLSFLMFVSAPLWVPALLEVPTQTLQPMTLIEIGIMAPMFALLTIMAARRPLAGSTEWLLIGSFTIELLLVEMARYGTYDLGFRVMPSIAVVIPVAVLALARLRISRCLIIIGAYLGITIALGRYWPQAQEDGAQRDPTAWLMESILLGVILMSVIWSRLALRRQWASALLMEMMAYRDVLTGLANRRAFEDHYDKVVRAVARGQNKLLLFALIDLDHFKKLNDHYGHDYGDGVLAEIGLVLAGLARRPLDIAARLGGEEFVLLLYDCDAAAAEARLQAIIDSVRDLQIEHAGNGCAIVTCSVGGALIGPDDVLSDAYRQADACLYAVKRSGRNACRLHD